MKIISKILALILSVIMILPLVSYAQGSDLKELKYSEALTFFSDLKLISGYDSEGFVEGVSVTRGEFAVMLAKIMGYNGSKPSANLPYEDIVPSDSAYGSIAFLYSNNIITDSSLFNPNNPIFHEQALKMCIAALGYNEIALQKGGYPFGYIEVAREEGLLSSVEYNGRGLYMEEAVSLLYKTMNTNTLTIKSVTNADIKYGKGETFIKNIFHLTKNQGLIIAVNNCSIDGKHSLEDNEIIIDYRKLKTSKTGLLDYVGQYTTYYVTNSEAEEEDVVVSIPKISGNQVIVKAEDIDGSTEIGEFKYEHGKTSETLKIAIDAFYVFNGVALKAPINADLMPDIGSVTLVDNNDDGEYDVVLVWSYENYMFNGGSDEEGVISYKYDKGSLSFSGSDDFLFVFKNGKKSTISGLNIGDVISVAIGGEGTNSKVINILASDKKVSGIVSEINRTDDKVVLDVGTISASKELIDNIVIGVYYDFILNVFDVAIDMGTQDVGSPDQVGYLLNIASSTSISQDGQFKIITSNGKTVILKSNGKIRYSVGGTDKSKATAMEIRSKLSENGSFVPQLIKYEEENGKIVSLTSSKVTDIYDWDSKGEFRLNSEAVGTVLYSYYDQVYESLTYSTTNKQFMTNRTDTLCFVINDSDEKDYMVGSIYPLLSNISHHRYTSYKAYNFDDLGVAKYVVLKQNPTTSYYMQTKYPYIIIRSINKFINEDGEEKYKLKGFGATGETSYVWSNEEIVDRSYYSKNKGVLSIKGLQVGDMIQVETNSKNEVADFTFIHRISNEAERYDDIYSTNTGKNISLLSNFTFFGDIIYVNNSGFVIQNSLMFGPRTVLKVNMQVFVYDKATEKLFIGSAKDVYTGCKAFVTNKVNNVLTVIVVK